MKISKVVVLKEDAEHRASTHLGKTNSLYSKYRREKSKKYKK